jgi:hypothetical protein
MTDTSRDTFFQIVFVAALFALALTLIASTIDSAIGIIGADVESRSAVESSIASR